MIITRPCMQKMVNGPELVCKRCIGGEREREREGERTAEGMRDWNYPSV